MESMTNPKTLAEFLSTVDRRRFQEETGYSAQLISRAKREGLFPAHWFWTVREYCERHGLDVPEHLFKGHPAAKVEALI